MPNLESCLIKASGFSDIKSLIYHSEFTKIINLMIDTY